MMAWLYRAAYPAVVVDMRAGGVSFIPSGYRLSAFAAPGSSLPLAPTWRTRVLRRLIRAMGG